MNATLRTYTMKNLLTTALATSALGLFAQNANVVSAYNYMNDGKLDKAVEYIEPATSDAKTGASEKTWRYRGNIYRLIALGDDEALKAKYPNAIDLAVESYLRANELDVKGSYKVENVQALGALQGASLNAGNDAFGAKNYDEAIRRYAVAERIANAFGQADTNAIFNSALAYESKGDGANAIKRYQDALAAGYEKPEIYRYIASLQRKGDDLSGAINSVQLGRRRFPDNKDLILDEMSYLLAADRSEDAEASVALAIQTDPNNAVLYSVQGSLFDKKAGLATDAKDEAGMNQWYDKAEAAYKTSIEKDPKYFDAYFNIGVLYNNRAAYEYEKCNAIKSDTEYSKCKTKADEIFLKAVPYFEQAHELDAQDRQTMQQLMKLYAKTNDQSKFASMKAKLGQ
jgi:tetratricopeptide (TPR) repeat protein